MNNDRQQNPVASKSATTGQRPQKNERAKAPKDKAETRTVDASKPQKAGDTPRPQPNEQDSSSFAQQQQRSTGVSGHTGST
jgi:hypothetical protein